MIQSNEIRNFLRSLLSGAERRPDTVSRTAWGKTRTFVRYDIFDDTFVLEDGILDRLENRDSVVLVPKADLMPHGDGGESRVFGNVTEKYKFGRASSLEVTNASSDIISAQGNYIQAVMNVISAQVALEDLLNK